MTARIISGKDISQEIKAELKEEIASLKEKHCLTPGLATILVGENPASKSYVGSKIKTCEALGIYSEHYHLPDQVSEIELLELVNKLNEKDDIHGILVQVPLPKHIDETKVLYAISPDKDIDGFHPVNVGKMVISESPFPPCTPAGIQQMLIRSGIKTEGAEVVVVGRSNIVGKPITNMLLQKNKGANATVTICHSRTRDIAFHTKRADILIAAMGQPKFITADMVKEGSVIIDVGSNRIGETSEGKGIWCGDVDFDNVKEKAGAITPVPGGVGPMTITMLMVNTVKAVRLAKGVM